MSSSEVLRWWVGGGITLLVAVVPVHGQAAGPDGGDPVLDPRVVASGHDGRRAPAVDRRVGRLVAPVVYVREDAGDVVGSTLVTPPVVVYSEQSQRTGAAASVTGLAADVYRTLDNEPLTYSVFVNLSPSTGLVFPGAMVADNMGLSNGFVPGVHEISSYDLLVFRSSLDPQPGMADFHVELWDGDPLCMYETPGGGYACAPIPGSEADFVDVPANTIMTARAVLPPGVTAPNDRVWMVLSGSQTVNPSPCRLGWDISYGRPFVGRTHGLDVVAGQFDHSGEGSCCGDGSACDVSGGLTCPEDAQGERGLCSDGDAESFYAWSIRGSLCDRNGGSGNCSNLVASIQTPARYAVSLLPTGNDAAGNLDAGASIEGHHITLARAGTSVFVEIRIDDWDPDDAGTRLKAWEVDIDSTGYASGTEGVLSPKLVACSADDDCRAVFGGFCEQSGAACVMDADCPLNPTEQCSGSTCNFPAVVGGYCQPGFILDGREDYVFHSSGFDLRAVDTDDLDYRFASSDSDGAGAADPEPFPDEGVYAGTLVLDVPVDAKGTFTVGMLPVPHTILKSAAAVFLLPIGLQPVEITVQTGRCCYQDWGGATCVDEVTQTGCDSFGPLSLFTPGAACGAVTLTCDCNDNGVGDDEDILTGTSGDCNDNLIPDECEPECTGNSIPDECDLASGTSQDCSGNGVPDECEPDCNGNGSADDCDVVNGTSDDCNESHVPDECEPPQPDCNANGVADGCDVRDHTSEDCDGDLVPDECELAFDCNENGTADGCDIASGASADCNGNGLPDECDIALGVVGDCNGDGVPDDCDPDCNANGRSDACDIVAGGSGDCNGNKIPDECDLGGGSSQDCNFNFAPDECDIAGGSSSDCNGNGHPDECEMGALFSAMSGPLSPIGYGSPQQFTIVNAPAARDFVRMYFDAVADLDLTSEWIAVGINGSRVATVFDFSGRECPAVPETDWISLYPDVFNSLVSGGDAVITLTPSSSVSEFLCQGTSYIRVRVEYTASGADCNQNDVLDVCEPDCNGNGVPNACEIADGTALDADGNGVPDACECPPGAPSPEVPAVEKNRYLSFVPGNFGQNTALRITCNEMPAPFAGLRGVVMWVGPPHSVSELGGAADATPPTFTAATLQCRPHFMDWGSIEPLHVYHRNIIPGAHYTFQVVDVGCDLADEGSFSPSLGVATGRWGDLVGPYVAGAWGKPDGVVSVVFDAVALIDAFKSIGDAPHKSRADLSPETPDRLITVYDLTKVLFSFSGWSYPFTVDPSPCVP